MKCSLVWILLILSHENVSWSKLICDYLFIGDWTFMFYCQQKWAKSIFEIVCGKTSIDSWLKSIHDPRILKEISE